MLKSWRELALNYKDTLVLGNGASIAVSPYFSYESLFEEAKNDNFIDSNVIKIFEYMGTKDFERVLTVLWHAYQVNQALNIQDNLTVLTYKNIRNALIQILQRKHPKCSEITQHLKPIYEFMKGFNTVISLNYDLIVYWAMLANNDDLDEKWFKDGLTEDGSLHPGWQRLREPYKATGATLVFYPHGHLALSADAQNKVQKIKKKPGYDLLDTIFDVWKTKGQIPVFVSEGTSSEKENAIGRWNYLSKIYNEVFNDLGSNVTIYGWDISENDTNILKKICKNDDMQIAISVLTTNLDNSKKSKEDIDKVCQRFESKIHRINKTITVDFFDAKEQGCWNNI